MTWWSNYGIICCLATVILLHFKHCSTGMRHFTPSIRADENATLKCLNVTKINKLFFAVMVVRGTRVFFSSSNFFLHLARKERGFGVLWGTKNDGMSKAKIRNNSCNSMARKHWIAAESEWLKKMTTVVGIRQWMLKNLTASLSSASVWLWWESCLWLLPGDFTWIYSGRVYFYPVTAVWALTAASLLLHQNPGVIRPIRAKLSSEPCSSTARRRDAMNPGKCCWAPRKRSECTHTHMGTQTT